MNTMTDYSIIEAEYLTDSCLSNEHFNSVLPINF